MNWSINRPNNIPSVCELLHDFPDLSTDDASQIINAMYQWKTCRVAKNKEHKHSEIISLYMNNAKQRWVIYQNGRKTANPAVNWIKRLIRQFSLYLDQKTRKWVIQPSIWKKLDNKDLSAQIDISDAAVIFGSLDPEIIRANLIVQRIKVQRIKYQNTQNAEHEKTKS